MYEAARDGQNSPIATNNPPEQNMNTYRSNTGSALTRKARKALAGRVEAVTVKSDGYGHGGEVFSTEIESLMSARQILIDAGLTCTDIKIYKAIAPRFYIQFPELVAA
jgi:hypothetical protein